MTVQVNISTKNEKNIKYILKSRFKMTVQWLHKSFIYFQISSQIFLSIHSLNTSYLNPANLFTPCSNSSLLKYTRYSLIYSITYIYSLTNLLNTYLLKYAFTVTHLYTCFFTQMHILGYSLCTSLYSPVQADMRDITDYTKNP